MMSSSNGNSGSNASMQNQPNPMMQLMGQMGGNAPPPQIQQMMAAMGGGGMPPQQPMYAPSPVVMPH